MSAGSHLHAGVCAAAQFVANLCLQCGASQRMHPCEAVPGRHHLSRRRPSSTGTFVPTTVHLAAAHTGATKTVARYEQGNDSMSEEEI